jgi:hypothetical protein
VPRNHWPLYRDLAAWALANGMKTDIVYLARFDIAAFEDLTTRRAEELRAGRLARDILWITAGAPPDLLRKMPRDKDDLLDVIDGIGVYAPDFRRAPR